MGDNGPADDVLVKQMREGSMDALGILYDRYAPLVISIVGRVFPELPAADRRDICQDVFVEVYRSIKGYSERGKFSAWLGVIARRHAGKSRRKRRFVLRHDPDGEESDMSPAPSADAQAAARQQVGRALAALNEGEREVFLLHEAEQLKGEDIAKELGIKINTVWTRLHSARKKMRKALRDEP